MSELSVQSPISGNSYSLPGESDPNLLDFIKCNSDKKIVVVQGLGFVGTAMSLVVANAPNHEYAVIGIDLATQNSYWKIADINEGICPIISSDPLIQEFYNKSREQNNFIATHDPKAFSFAEFIVVDINLDVSKSKDANGRLLDFDVPLDSFKSAIETLSKHCKEDVTVLVETTVPPGTCSKIIQPILEKNLIERGLLSNKYFLGHSYERVMPGPNYINSIKNFYRVYSGINERSANRIEEFLMTIISTDEYPLTRLQNTESTEMAKVLENSFRAMNIAFAVEWSRFAENAGVNLYEVVNAIRQRPTHANLMYPGIGVGGYCLTKDPLMASWASKSFFGLTKGLNCSEQAVQINDLMPENAYYFFKRCISGKKLDHFRVALMGVAYAPGIGDTRFSPVEGFAKKLLLETKDVFFHDPYLSFWQELGVPISNDEKALLEIEIDILVISTGHQYYVEEDKIYNLLDLLPNHPVIIDTVGLLDHAKLSKNYILGDNFFVLGVGS